MSLTRNTSKFYDRLLRLDKVHVQHGKIVRIAMADRTGLDVVDEIGVDEGMGISRRVVMAGDARGTRWENFADESHAVALRNDRRNRFRGQWHGCGALDMADCTYAPVAAEADFGEIVRSAAKAEDGVLLGQILSGVDKVHHFLEIHGDGRQVGYGPACFVGRVGIVAHDTVLDAGPECLMRAGFFVTHVAFGFVDDHPPRNRGACIQGEEHLAVG